MPFSSVGAISPEAYDTWYQTQRGRWIGNAEYRLLVRLLAPQTGETLLDAGCGTGYFTRRFAEGLSGRVVGLDPSAFWTSFARSHAGSRESYVRGVAEALPFADGSFDFTVSVAALCFAEDARKAASEIVRVTRRRFAVGLLNRQSLLYRRKGKDGGSGSYRGAVWHRPREAKGLFRGLLATDLSVRTAVFLPSGNPWARGAERLLPSFLPWGGLLVVSGRGGSRDG
ncbi:MAG: methyltransferase domain-containing protein [Thermodesulfobacteriota bacterium]